MFEIKFKWRRIKFSPCPSLRAITAPATLRSFWSASVRFITALLLATAWLGAATAQAPPDVIGAAVIPGTATLSVTNASSRVQLPGSGVTYSAVTIYNYGAKDAYYVTGGSTVTATTSNTLVKAGTAVTGWTGNNQWVAAITGGTDTTSLLIYQSNGQIFLQTPGSAGGGSGGGLSVVDESAFTAGSSNFTPSGCFFQTTGTANPLTNGQQGMTQCTAQRAWWVNIRDSTGTELGTLSNPFVTQSQGLSIGSTTAGSTGALMMGATLTNPPANTTGQNNPASMTTDGGLRIGHTAPVATTMQNAAVANGNGTSLNVAGYTTAVLDINCSVACSGGTAINFEGNTDSAGGNAWVALSALLKGTATIATSATTSGDWSINVAGYALVRARISAYSAGTITVKGYQTTADEPRLAANTNLFLGGSPVGTGNPVTTQTPALDPCQGNAATYTPVNIGSATTTRIAANAGGKKIYVCSAQLLAFLADNVAITEGTGGTCGTGTAGVVGGTTTATGISFPAQGGLSVGNGSSAVWATATAGDDLCFITSTTGPLTGHVKWVQQ